ncbi:hypothetical protein N7509_008308 [Penicillium cosmopolitanum]|uniref:Xylanolytic transcriptional activator regulatory domain-containing protein n=1 Tax=Penicillium cosmopolitanum TaxID=1131564 RepID=A0A9W9VMC4_9EURO|nr:uncharacterized protein N7509_008308 [Penicillium cosmopolitanum]KAJ5385767.1 hypothetical protein N7509_008308 [Penicillium cosmopolitanum]
MTGDPLATMGHVQEDFNYDEKVQAMGFIGEHSEMSWLYKLKHDLDQDSAAVFNKILERPPISYLNYFQDDVRIPGLNYVSLLWRPPQHIADKLVDDYFQAVHPSFPIIGKDIFLSQYRSYYVYSNAQPGKRWIAMLNLVFAIAAGHSLLFDRHPEIGGYGEHGDYFARAWRLGISDAALLDHPNLQQVQVEGLTAFYLLSKGQVNRSWRVIGVSIRSALAMGLSLRNETDNISPVSKETRYRVWWALSMLDTVLCVMTGRPPSIGEIYCTTPLPIPYRDEDLRTDLVTQLIINQSERSCLLASLLSSTDPDLGSGGTSIMHRTLPARTGTDKTKESERAAQPVTKNVAPNTSLYFLYAIDLDFLMRDTVEALYAPGAIRRSWLEMEVTISNFDRITNHWLSRLPVEFSFANLDGDQSFVRQRASLGFRFYATKILISQPCLRRLAYHPPNMGPEGATCDTMAAMCVQTAHQMLDLFPEEVDTSWLFRISPWWCILHYLMHPTTILLIELFTRTRPGTSKAQGIIDRVQKAVRWLCEMSTKDPSSQGAWMICRDILCKHGSKFAIDFEVKL